MCNDRAAASRTSTCRGLAIVKSIMDLHGGSAKMESTSGGPTAFRARFRSWREALGMRRGNSTKDFHLHAFGGLVLI